MRRRRARARFPFPWSSFMKPYPAGSWCRSVLCHSFRPFVLAALSLPAAAQAPVALFTTSPNPAEGGSPLTVQFIDQSTGTLTSWLWNFGDGGAGSTEQNPTHVFTLVQPFDVTLTVSGAQGSDTFTLLHAVDVLPTINGVVGAPPSLASLAVPVPDDLGSFVRDQAAAVRLGKALFWDVQVGSDGMTACASCHFQAGANDRIQNSLSAGADGVFAELASGNPGGPNSTLVAGDFPFHRFLDPERGTALIRDVDDRHGATGVVKKTFAGVNGTPVDAGATVADPTFHVGFTNVRQSTGRDAPTTIGAIFLQRIFWDGRANHFFNGVNIWGDVDPNARVLQAQPDGSLAEVHILLDNGATASQAVGPPLSDVEMSWNGRSFRELGR